MGGPGSGRRKGGTSNTKGQAAAANRVVKKRLARGAPKESVKSYQKSLQKKFPGLKGRLNKI